MPMRFLALFFCVPLLLAPSLAAPPAQSGAFLRALSRAESALARNRLVEADEALRAAQERDPKSTEVWRLRAQLGKALKSPDLQAYALHRWLRLVLARGDKETRQVIEAELYGIDPIAQKAIALLSKHKGELADIAQAYEKKSWPHAAIAVHKRILALDPENELSRISIERLASAPDPSLAGDARPPDLFADVSEEWIEEYDAKHAEWSDRGKLERDNYVTQTDAGYEILVRAGEAMEQMNAFYRQFFAYGTEDDGRNVSRINLMIFRDKDEYLKFGSSPVEWSGGQFTGSAVETYVSSGFESMMGVLFHEAAHQFVGLATNAAGWLNEGLASFFEGCRILKNGTVEMNLPANHRLFPLVNRMKAGWMQGPDDGTSRENPSQTPRTAPTFRIVLENKYEWGPPWYAPTWGVVYFLYNYQDPGDGRYVYRHAFRNFINSSGGKMGDTAVSNFEEVVLANPMPPTKGTKSTIELPQTVAQLDDVWKKWLITLSEQQSGALSAPKPYLKWAEYAIKRGERSDAAELFEKGLSQNPEDSGLLAEFGNFLVEEKKIDRATKLLRRAMRGYQKAGDEKAADKVLAQLRKFDPQLRQLERLENKLAATARSTVRNYIDQDFEMVAMELALRWGNELDIPELFIEYEDAVRKEGRSLAEWRLAYNEENLDGWLKSQAFASDGLQLKGAYGKYDPRSFDYQFLGLDEVTSGDFSFEAELLVKREEVLFAGLLFGRKSQNAFHALFLYPPGDGQLGYVDLASFYSSSDYDTWRHNPVQDKAKAGGTSSGEWYKLRIDVTGNAVDVWVDDQFVVTQEFSSRDVLRGSFGLVMSQGKALYRNVRYLSRNPRDPSGRIDRRLRLGIDADADVAEAGMDWEDEEDPEPSADGSWIGKRPAFPKVSRWLKDERRNWKQGATHPQLLVLWSCEQNDVIPVDKWLSDLAQRYQGIGLKIVSIVSNANSGQSSGKSADSYLESFPFPGSVAVDEWDTANGIGRTFSDYSIAKFQLPRLLLMDVDGRVVWEGAPGFSRDVGWPGEQSFLEGPLEDLVAKRKLEELQPWKERWTQRKDAGAGAMLALLEEAKDFDPVFPAVREAQARLETLENHLSDIDGTVLLLQEQGAEPAIEILMEWSKTLGHNVELSKASEGIAAGGPAKSWRRAKSMLKPLLRKIEKGTAPGSPASAVKKLRSLPGLFPALLADALEAAEDDPAALTELVLEAGSLPRTWLANDFLKW